MCVCLCAQDRKRTSREREIRREGEARINTKPSGGLLLPEREGTGHPAESGEGESNRERDTSQEEEKKEETEEKKGERWMDSRKVTGRRDGWGWRWEGRVDVASDKWTDTRDRRNRADKNNADGKIVGERWGKGQVLDYRERTCKRCTCSNTD